MALSRMLAASGVISDLSQSKNTMYGPGVQTTVGVGVGSGVGVQVGVGVGSGVGTGVGAGAGAPKLKIRPPRIECERKRPSHTRPETSVIFTLSALKKRYFSEMSIESVSGARMPAIACQAKTVSESSIVS